MNCAHVLDLIDAGPFADYSHEHLTAAWAHARECATCGPALQVAQSLAVDLRALPEPAAPPDLAGIVMARIAQESETEADRARTRAEARRPEWFAGAIVAGGFAAGIAIISTMPLGLEGIGALVTLRTGGLTGLATMPATLPAILAVGAGLVMYAAGLFAPLRHSTSGRSQSDRGQTGV